MTFPTAAIVTLTTMSVGKFAHFLEDSWKLFVTLTISGTIVFLINFGSARVETSFSPKQIFVSRATSLEEPITKGFALQQINMAALVRVSRPLPIKTALDPSFIASHR